MAYSVRHRIRGAFIASGFARGMHLAEQLALIPLFLAAWGAGLYGEWIGLNSIATLVAFANLGIGPTASSRIVLQYASGDQDAANRTWVTSVCLSVFTSAAGVALLLISATVADLSPLLSLRALQGGEVVALVVVMALTVVSAFFSEPLGAVLSAVRGAGTASTIYAVTKGLGITAVAVALQFGCRPLSIAIILLAAYWANVLVSLVLALHYAPWLSFRLSAFDTQEIKHSWRSALGFFGIFISFNVLNVHAPRIIVSHFFEAEAVAAFAIFATYTRTARNIAAMTAQAFQVEIGRAFGGGRLPRARRLLEVSIGSAVAVAAILLVIEVSLAPLFIPVWTRGHIEVDWALLAAFSAVALAGTYFDVVLLAASAANKVGLISASYSTGLALALGAAMILVPITGQLVVIGMCLLLPELLGGLAASSTLASVVGRFRLMKLDLSLLPNFPGHRRRP